MGLATDGGMGGGNIIDGTFKLLSENPLGRAKLGNKSLSKLERFVPCGKVLRDDWS